MPRRATTATDTRRPSPDTVTLSLGGKGHVTYPASWVLTTAYYGGRSMPLGLISSVPLGPCASTFCLTWTVPSDAVAVEFDWNPMAPGDRPYTGPNNDTVGGQPAYREDWGPVNGVDADEGHTWLLHLPTGALRIDAALKGPDLAPGRAALQQILASVVVP